MRESPIITTCPKCGQEKETRTVTSTKCLSCNYLIWVGRGEGFVRRIRSNRSPSHVSHTGRLAGYCAGCGLMRMKYERGGCLKCGCEKMEKKAPPPAGKLEVQSYRNLLI